MANYYSQKKDWYFYANNNYRIILDTCALMNSLFDDKVASDLVRALKENNKTVCIVQKTILEMKKHKASSDPSKSQGAKRMERTINFLKSKGVVQFDRISNTEHGDFADSAIRANVLSGMADNNILVVTYDAGLSRDILKERESESVKPKRIDVCRIGKDGSLVPFVDKSRSVYGTKQTKAYTGYKKAPVNRNDGGQGYRQHATYGQSQAKQPEMGNKPLAEAIKYANDIDKSMPFSKLKNETIKRFKWFCEETKKISNENVGVFKKIGYITKIGAKKKELLVELKKAQNKEELIEIYRKGIEDINNI